MSKLMIQAMRSSSWLFAAPPAFVSYPCQSARVRIRRPDVSAGRIRDSLCSNGRPDRLRRVATLGSSNLNITGLDQPLRVRGEITSAGYFRVLRVQAAVGRTFLPEEDITPGKNPVALIAYGKWQRLFGGLDEVRLRGPSASSLFSE